jgi:hypothetical protein
MSAIFGVIALVGIIILKLVSSAGSEDQESTYQYDPVAMEKMEKYVWDPKYNPYNT